MHILAFDTSSKTASVAILHDEIIIYETVIKDGLNRSEVLLPAIEKACLQTGIKIMQIDLFACAIGPGSFTGLRVGVSTLKGFLLATEKPGVGVSSLAAIALSAGKCSKIIYSIMDAGRGQVYMAGFKYKEKGLLEQIGKEQVLNQSEIKYDKDAIFIADGAVRHADIFWTSEKCCRASFVGLLGRGKYHRNELLDPDVFVPIYLRSVDVQRRKSLLES
ncbi:MAG: tRNA (adenosine(37)-N6)-threonylcarbamoyltransferase complex dimerization subunit type 1 TsaB [Syntrophaceae bacterium]|nr:tRNA (adenosine(37)-N6)-threonylcarbamoyltransferase complex dimerization subunit type 1 TsaB [Syntrophaceae bacterium]